MVVITKLEQDEIKKLPYDIIYETTSRSIWNTGRRKRMMAEEFQDWEIDDIKNIITTVKRWARYGLPKELEIGSEALLLWNKLAYFCYKVG